MKTRAILIVQPPECWMRRAAARIQSDSDNLKICFPDHFCFVKMKGSGGNPFFAQAAKKAAPKAANGVKLLLSLAVSHQVCLHPL
jgi:hypothetical protein